MTVPREGRGLGALATFRRLSTRQIADFMFDGASLTAGSRAAMASRLLARMRARRLLSVSRRAPSGPRGGAGERIYQISEAGARYLARVDPAFSGPGRPPRDGASVEHALASADVYLALVRSARTHAGHEVSRWEPGWRAAELLGSSRVVPDGRIVYRTPAWEVDALIEVDLATERPAQFRRRILEYVAALRNGAWRRELESWPVVLVVTPGRERAASLWRATSALLEGEHDAKRLLEVAHFYFGPIADVLEDPLGRIWLATFDEGLRPLLPSIETSAPAAADT
jgi:hypothetical protein